MRSKKIGFFDSGIGGVTVLKECIKVVPNFSYIYYSDSINNPYGDKSREEVLKIASSVVEYLIDKGCNIIVIACNTASAICVESLRIMYPNIIFIAIEPAIKCAYDNLEDNTLIMATKGTMDSEKFHNLYDKYHRNNFYLKSCVGLANLIEQGNTNEIKEYLNENIKEYKEKVNSVVLGCTHYPLIKKEIKEILGDVTFYDGSIGVAKRLKEVIKENNFISNNKTQILFIDSSNDKIKEERFKNLLDNY